MKKSVVVLLHIGFWLCYFILIMVMLAMFFRDDEQPGLRIENAFRRIVFFALIPSVISFYSFYLLLFPKFLKQKKIVLSIVYGILISIGSALIGYAISYSLYGAGCITEEGEESSFIGAVLFISFIALVSGIVALVIHGFITWFAEIKLKEALKQKNHEMEMALVKSQLDPHFLFNTINNIDVLILKNANKASEYLNKLSDIMRFMLFETKTDEIPLSKEIEYIEKYIELQKIRTSNSNYVSFKLTGTPKNKTIAPMVFISFIENAFKHTTNKKLEDAIIINIIIDDDFVKFECVNKLDTSRKLQQENNGLGNDLITKRLNLIYQDRHTLEVFDQNDLYGIYLTIKND